MESLKAELEFYIQKSSKQELHDEVLNKLYSIFPFNKFEYIISHLIAENIISLDEYLNIRSAYLERNKYLYLFEITAPRTFGETWAQRHLNELIPELQRPNKKLDANYSGEYDFWYDGIKIEVKASRTVERKSGEPLIIKALSSNSDKGFDMNFQQIKPNCCDVFVWIGVWREVIKYWVLSNEEVRKNKYYSKGQHRGNINEGQLWIKETNIQEFQQYECSGRELLQKILEKNPDK